MIRAAFLPAAVAASICALATGLASAADAAASFDRDAVHAALGALVPAGIELSEVQVDGGRTTVTGLSPDTVQLSQLLRKIDNAPEFEAPELAELTNVDGMSAFRLVFEIKCPRDGSATSPLCATAAAQPKTVFKCRIDGTLTFQGHPCPPGKDA